MKLDRRTFVSASAALGAGGMTTMTAPAATAVEASAAAKIWHEQAYFIPASLEATWRAFVTPAERTIWWGYPTDVIKSAAEVRPLRFIRTVTDHPGLPGITQTRQSFSAVPGGTRIVYGVSGFGSGPIWENALQSTLNGVNELISDMTLFLRTRAGFPRHVRFRSFDLLRGTRDAPGGLEVFTVAPGTLLAEVGLQPGDTIVSVSHIPIFGIVSAHAVARAFKPGDTVEVTWVRGDKLMSATGHATQTVTQRAKGT